MAHLHSLDVAIDHVREELTKSFQSARINFLIGSGASHPAIPPAGNIEQEIADLLSANEIARANARRYHFLSSVQEPMNKLLRGTADGQILETLRYYEAFVTNIETLLTHRRTNILPRQVTLFTTNYDLLFEKAAGVCPFTLINTGVTAAPALNEKAAYSSRQFFVTAFQTGDHYDYKVEIPSINVVKLHGCLSWIRDGDQILCGPAIKDLLPDLSDNALLMAFVDSYAIVLPQLTKFHDSVLDRTYYDLLRVYANELDKETALLIAFGFSFRDEHILHITRRALKNPSLRVVIFAHSVDDRDRYLATFEGHNNVHIIAAPPTEQIDFQKFNEILESSIPGGRTWL